MNTSEIEAFLAVVRSGNISKASKNLFISQSTISQRIKALETKLEVRLIERSKGITSINLTNEGENFYKIALKWEQLMTDSKMLKQKEYNQSISIAGVDSINNFVLNDVFRSMVGDHPSISYFFRTHQSNEIYTLVEDNTVDMGFILQERVSESIIKEEFFREELVLVLNRKLGSRTSVTLDSLDTTKELYINWGHVFTLWHEKHFGYGGTLGVETHTGILINEFLKSEEYWAIIPVSMAKQFTKESNLQIIRFSQDKPYRICYIIYDQNNENAGNIHKDILNYKSLTENKIQLNDEGTNLEIQL
ncbi:DNA-binding transcriptional regulator, LysR family [Lacicoccus qingdaonensis]|uniref:DNA-binding transcriptional regulator, LysR family n=2 Tax=Lacicoccus qingdaonensis TaxID=576118 RepID=A0A1G9DAG8_9BACL|nr:DNA-binding transcriptional regulator, LysR family [Salinicoccus qingdaonensis]